MTASRLGKMPTTSVRRRSSLLSRSCGLLRPDLLPVLVGEGGEGQARRRRRRRACVGGVGEAFGRAGRRPGRAGPTPGRRRAGRRSCAPAWRPSSGPTSGTLVNRLRMKWVRHRCQRAPGRVARDRVARPSWASEITSCTPARPRATRPRRKASQPAPSSLVITSKPSTSRWPSALTPTAMHDGDVDDAAALADLLGQRVEPHVGVGAGIQRPVAERRRPRRRGSWPSATPALGRSPRCPASGPCPRPGGWRRPARSTRPPPPPAPARPAGAAPTATPGSSCPPAASGSPVDRAHPGVELAGPVAVAAVGPLRGPLAVAGVAHHVDLGRHQPLGERRAPSHAADRCPRASRCLRNHSSASMLLGTTAFSSRSSCKTSLKMTRWSSRLVDPQPLQARPVHHSRDSTSGISSSTAT